MNVLAIVAHPDDADIWCGGTLRKYYENGDDVYICVVANGNLGTKKYSEEEIVGIREKEQLEAAKIYNAQVRFIGINDFEVIDTIEARRSILDAIRWANPDVILTHYPYDTCTDHNITGDLVTRALLYINFNNIKLEHPPVNKMPSVFFFDTYAGLGFQPDVFVDISEQFKKKKEAFEKHQSQIEYVNTGTGWSRVVDILSAFRGLQSDYMYAEGFIGCKMYGFLPNYKLLP